MINWKPTRRIVTALLLAPLIEFAHPSNAAELRNDFVIATPTGALEAEFVNPPAAAKPRSYFFVTDVSGEHFATDVQAMSRSGLAGLLFMHAGYGPSRMKKIDRMMTEPWMQTIRALMRSTKECGMAFAISMADANGSGGPWITEEYAAKKLVFSESQVDGPVQEVALPPAVGPNGLPWEVTWRLYDKPKFYRDVAVLAFREAPGTPLRPAAVSASSCNEYAAKENFWPANDTTDRDPHTFWRSLQPDKVKTPREKDQEWVQHAYREPLAAVGAVVIGGPEGGPWPCG